MNSSSPIVYCNCQYTRVISTEVKNEILKELSESELEFHSVPDLCELASRKDPVLHKISQSDSPKIIACYPRAVKALFHQCGTNLTENAKILNMREDSPDSILQEVGIQPAVEKENDDG